MAEQLLLVRHSWTGPDWQGRMLGKTDVPIFADSVAETTQLAKALSRHSIEACYCSPLLRARQTISLLSDGKGINLPQIQLEKDLREIDFGLWEGFRFSEIADSYPEKVKQWNEWREDFAFPDGEKIGDFVVRIRRVSKRMAADEADTVLAITHGGVIRMMICLLLRLDPKNYLLFDVKPASLAILSLHSAGAVLSGFNLGID